MLFFYNIHEAGKKVFKIKKRIISGVENLILCVLL